MLAFCIPFSRLVVIQYVRKCVQRTYSGKSVFGLVFFSILDRVVDKSESSRLSTSESSSEAKQNNSVHFADFEHLDTIVVL
jgi:hypothetical protein